MKSAGDKVREHCLADIPWGCRGADDGNRGGRENRPQRRDCANMVALADPLPHRLGRSDIERYGDLTERAAASDDESCVFEDVQHRLVGDDHLGVEAMDASLGRNRRELLEHPHPNAMPLEIVRDRQRDLSHPLLAQPIVTG